MGEDSPHNSRLPSIVAIGTPGVPSRADMSSSSSPVSRRRLALPLVASDRSRVNETKSAIIAVTAVLGELQLVCCRYRERQPRPDVQVVHHMTTDLPNLEGRLNVQVMITSNSAWSSLTAATWLNEKNVKKGRRSHLFTQCLLHVTLPIN